MFIFAQLIGIFIASAGIAIALKPQVASVMVAFWEKEQRFYWGGLIRLFFAGILMTAAPDARFPLAVLVLGVLFLLSGILVYALPDAKLFAVLEWFKKLSAIAVRAWGLVACFLGLLIVYWA